jgi:hypothetical protein
MINSMPTISLIIDLTNTDKYYTASDINNKSIQYVKIKTTGHHVPKDDIVQQFFEAVDKALAKNPDSLIGTLMNE